MRQAIDYTQYNNYSVYTRDVMDKRSMDTAQQHEVLRLLRFLSNDIKRTNITLKQPNTWVIKCVVNNCKKIHYQTQHWLRDLNKLLRFIEQQIDAEKEGILKFYELDNLTPLFPTNDGFELVDLLTFIKKIQAHLTTIEPSLER